MDILNEMAKRLNGRVIQTKDSDQANLIVSHLNREFRICVLFPPGNSSKMFLSIPVINHDGNEHLGGILRRRGRKNFIWKTQKITNGETTLKYCVCTVCHPTIESTASSINRLLKEASRVLDVIEQSTSTQQIKEKLRKNGQRRFLVF